MACVLIMAGCASPVAREGGVTQDVRTSLPDDGFAAVAFPDCANCFEPTVTLYDGIAYVVTTKLPVIARVEDAGVSYLDAPMPPGYPEARLTDVTIQFDELGRLWYHDVFTTEGLKGALYTGLHVARSDDFGQTWTVNEALWLHQEVHDIPVDRNWLAVYGDRVHAFCICPMNQLPQYWLSEDGGVTFDGPHPLVAAADMFRLIGAPAVLADGTISLSYFVAGQVGRGSQANSPAGIAAVTSRDGASWQRVLAVPPGTAVSCCGILMMTSNGAQFTLAYSDESDAIRIATSVDGLAWQSQATTIEGAAQPYPTAQTLASGQTLVQWFSREGETWTAHIGWADGTAHKLGTTQGLPSDFTTMASDSRVAVTAWPSANGTQVRVLLLADL